MDVRRLGRGGEGGSSRARAPRRSVYLRRSLAFLALSAFNQKAQSAHPSGPRTVETDLVATPDDLLERHGLSGIIAIPVDLQL